MPKKPKLSNPDFKDWKAFKSSSEWADLPKQDWGRWFSEYVIAGLVLQFFHAHKRFPKKIKLGNVVMSDYKPPCGTKECSGGATLSVELE